MIRLSSIYFLKWICFAFLASVFGIGITYSFRYLLLKIHGLIHLSGVPLYSFPLLAAFLCSLVIYRICPTSSEEGVIAYAKATNTNGILSLKASICHFFAALLTLGLGGSGGLIGPMVRTNAGIMSGFGNLFVRMGFAGRDRNTIIICGASAIFAVVFQAPVGAGLFAVEIRKRLTMRYLDIFPSIISSCLCIAIIRYVKLPALFPFYSDNSYIPYQNLSWIVLLGFITGFYSLLTIKFYGWLQKYMRRSSLQLKSMVAGTLIVSIVGYLIDQDLMGTSFPYFKKLITGEGSWPFEGIFHGRLLFAVFIFLAFFKGLTNCITVGSGLTAGFTGPSVIIGLFFGAAMANVLGIDIHSGTYHAFLAAGMSGVLSGTLHVPLAAAVMGAEIFGPAYVLPTIISSLIAFQIARRLSLQEFH